MIDISNNNVAQAIALSKQSNKREERSNTPISSITNDFFSEKS
jgi:hypothetical protein